MTVVDVTVKIREDKTVKIFWEGMTNGDTGAPVNLPRYPDKTVQVVGTFGTGGDVDLDGSPDNTTWGALSDLQGDVISIGDNIPVLIAENTEWIRPEVAGDATTDLDVTIIAVVR